MRIPLPKSLDAHARMASGLAEPRDAATIALVRDGADGLETYLLRRRSTLEFAPGVLVFPGGAVHDDDRQPLEWIGPDAGEWARRFRCDEDTARALVIAAVRETFEESSVLFASPAGGGPVVPDTSIFETERRALDAGELAFADFLEAHDLVIRADLLGAWGHWITPAFEPKRYDTRFFVAAVPEGQRVGELPREADGASWWPISALWPEIDAGSIILLPPTAVTCGELGQLTAAGLAEAVAARTFPSIEPQLVEEDGQLFLDYALEGL